MNVFVTVESFQGIIDNVEVHTTEERVNECEQNWLNFHEISDDEKRRCKSDDGIEFLIFNCEVND